MQKNIQEIKISLKKYENSSNKVRMFDRDSQRISQIKTT